MAELYEGYGIRFQYPDAWELTEQEQEGEIAITVSGPLTGFWSLNLLPACPSSGEVLASVVQAFKDEYEDLDQYEVEEEICDRPAVGKDFEFFCNHLLNSAWARTFELPQFTALVLYQTTDKELDESLPIFERITASLEMLDDDDSDDEYSYPEPHLPPPEIDDE